MSPNPRIHQPRPRSYLKGRDFSEQTISESTALWQAMKRRGDLEREAREECAKVDGGMLARLRHAIACLPFFG